MSFLFCFWFSAFFVMGYGVFSRLKTPLALCSQHSMLSILFVLAGLAFQGLAMATPDEPCWLSCTASVRAASAIRSLVAADGFSDPLTAFPTHLFLLRQLCLKLQDLGLETLLMVNQFLANGFVFLPGQVQNLPQGILQRCHVFQLFFGFCCRPLVLAAFFFVLDALLDISIERKSGAPRFKPGAAG